MKHSSIESAKVSLSLFRTLRCVSLSLFRTLRCVSQSLFRMLKKKKKKKNVFRVCKWCFSPFKEKRGGDDKTSAIHSILFIHSSYPFVERERNRARWSPTTRTLTTRLWAWCRGMLQHASFLFLCCAFISSRRRRRHHRHFFFFNGFGV